jgi:hypothetical protein
MTTKKAEQIKQIRDRLVERAAASAPNWSVPIYPAARHTANALMIGCLINRLPDEDASALCSSILEEQNENGSWSKFAGDGGDVSITLEVLEGLSLTKRPEVRAAIDRSVVWLQANRIAGDLQWETLLLLGAVHDTPRHRITRIIGSLLDVGLLRTSQKRSVPSSRGLRRAYHLLALDKPRALGQYHDLLELQRADGSWDGLTRTTIVVLAALRHSGLSLEDTAIERGWRFIRNHQHWGTGGLVQNPCDFSTMLHAAAIRSLVLLGTPTNDIAASVLTLLQTQRASGGWGIGSQTPTDLFTTAMVSHALTTIGDDPVETAWARRRAGMMMLQSQRRDGGWPLYAGMPNPYFNRPLFMRTKSSVDATAMVLRALTLEPSQHPHHHAALVNGAKFLVSRQHKHGLWASDMIGNALFTTARAIEALSLMDDERSRRAILKGLRALRDLQREDGGWGSHGKSTPAETAWVIRALQSVPGLYKQTISRARAYLMNTLDESGLVWCSEFATFPIPYDEPPVELWDLTTLWVLESFSPAPRRTPRKVKRRAKSIFDKRV